MALTDITTGGRVIQRGSNAVKITLGEGCQVGDLLGYSSGWKRALATTGTAIHARLVAGQSGITGDIITAYGDAVITGLSGGTAGNAVYLAEGTSYGEVIDEVPSTTGDINAPIGITIDASTVFLYPGAFPVYHDTDHLA